ncbi:MAG: bacterioferritin [Pseudomonadota bacterium]|nr:bacterioferritin [Pseudomonadota bacterium]
MRGDENIVNLLNDLLREELTAINQYFLHARMCKNWGFERLYAVIMESSIEEMRHARNVTDRILFLEGKPNLQALGKLYIGDNVETMFKNDLQREIKAVEFLRANIDICYQAKDHGSRELLEAILKDEEEHVDWLEAQLELISSCGRENYLAEQLQKK